MTQQQERLERKLQAMRAQAEQLQAQLNAVLGAISFAESELRDTAPVIDWSLLSAKSVPTTV